MGDKYGWNEWKETAEKNGISRGVFYSRIRQNWDKEKAATKPVDNQKHDKYGWYDWEEIALKNGISRKAFLSRVKEKWDKETAATKPISQKTDIYNWIEWAEIALSNGVNRNTFTARRKKGMAAKAAATKPLQKHSSNKKTNLTQLYTVFERHNPVFTGEKTACANYLEVDPTIIKNEHSLNRDIIIFEVEA